MNLKYFVIFVTVIELLCFACICVGEYTENQLEAISKLRSAVEKDLYQDYMHTDDYLYSWLQTRDMDVRTTIDAVLRAMKWRKEMKLESVIPTLNCNSVLPIDADIVAKNGQPIATISAGQWDIRKLILAGKSENYVLCIMRILEEMYEKIREQNALRQAEGKHNVTSFMLIANIHGYNLRQHACVGCIPAIVSTFINYDRYYPGIFEKFIIVNTPTIFDALLNVIKAALSERTRNIFVTYGVDKSKWSAELFKIIPKDQLSPVFGGSKQ